MFTKKSGSVLSMGELLLRFAPDAGAQWLRQAQMPVYVGGAEANVATALALWGLPSAYITALPDNAMGRQLRDYLTIRGIDASRIRFDKGRMGAYYLAAGNDMKHNSVIYDRAGSAFSLLRPGTIDWDEALQQVSWFNISAICPAVSESAAAVCVEALQAASAKGITVSLDLNYRSLLWQYGKLPQQVMPELLPYCDVLMGNIWSVETMLGIGADKPSADTGTTETYAEAAFRSAAQVQASFPKIKTIAYTFRFDENTGIRYFSTLLAGGSRYLSREYRSDHIVDKVGSGDCYMAGLIYGMYNGWLAEETLAFATAAAYRKLFTPGDVINKTADDILASQG